MRKILGLTIAALMAAPAAQAMTFTFDHGTVIAQGPIVAGDGTSLDSFLSAGHNNGRPLKTLVLNSPGGLVREGIAMADAVRAYHVDVVVPNNAECASACFLPFAAGEHKTVGRDARIGIHSATSTGGVGDDDGNATMIMARYAAQLGVPAALIGRMVETDSINMTWLDAAELQSMEAVTPSIRPGQRTSFKLESKSFFAWLYPGSSKVTFDPKTKTNKSDVKVRRLPEVIPTIIAPVGPF